jgi:hypothetical protein
MSCPDTPLPFCITVIFATASFEHLNFYHYHQIPGSRIFNHESYTLSLYLSKIKVVEAGKKFCTLFSQVLLTASTTKLHVRELV